MNRQNKPLYEETRRLLSPAAADRVLDIGCGNGYMLEMLAKRYACHCTGIDISESILKAAARRNSAFVKNGSMSFFCCGADKMPFENASFDKAYTINTVYFWDDLAGTMAEIKRVLKPRGIFINTLYTNEVLARLAHTQTGYKRFTQEQLIRAAQAVGLSLKGIKDNGHFYQYIVYKS